MTHANTIESLMGDEHRFPVADVAAVTALGVGIRLVFLILARNVNAEADECAYIYLATLWNRFGVYTDSTYYLWPPGYPFFLSVSLSLFGASGIFVTKLIQVALSGVVGWFVMLLAYRVATPRAVLPAGFIWAIYLPLIGFTHYLWPETLFLALFLPALYLLIRWWQLPVEDRAGGVREGQVRLLAAGLLIGLALLVKEVALGWCAVVVMLIVYRARRWGPRAVVSQAALFVLAVATVVAPWTLRNYEVYGRFAPVAATAGQNVFFGLNGAHWNVDYLGVDPHRIMQANAGVQRRLCDSPVAPWKRYRSRNVVDMSSANVRRGLAFAAAHPGYVARSRIKNLADWVTPTSFFLRSYAINRYSGLLRDPAVRMLLVGVALLLPILVLGGAVGGYFHALAGTNSRGVLGWTTLYFFLATSMVVAASRYRICIEPLLIVFAGAFFAEATRRRWRGRAVAYCLIGWGALVALWLINYAEIRELISIIQEQGVA